MRFESGDKLWSDVLEVVHSKMEIPSFKGKAHALVEEVTEDYLLLKLEEKQTTKNTIVKLSKSDFTKALSIINKNDGIRQKHLDSTKARYLLSILNMLPYFKIEFRSTKEKDRIKQTQFLVWNE